MTAAAETGCHRTPSIWQPERQAPALTLASPAVFEARQFVANPADVLHGADVPDADDAVVKTMLAIAVLTSIIEDPSRYDRRRIMSGVRPWLVLAAVLLAVLVYAGLKAPTGPRSLRTFNADRMADLETDMWQAYYRKENARLFRGLVTLMREQYRFSWVQAAITAFYLARPASRFAVARSDYDAVLPDLERAYARIGAWMGADFDPAAVARAELAWWVARRVPGQESPENVGRLIADENALIFGVPSATVLEPSVLRARAGRLRDEGGERADWPTVARLLHDSYRALHQAVNAAPAGVGPNAAPIRYHSLCPRSSLAHRWPAVIA